VKALANEFSSDIDIQQESSENSGASTSATNTAHWPVRDVTGVMASWPPQRSGPPDPAPQAAPDRGLIRECLAVSGFLEVEANSEHFESG
jgi:hypothetical protein